MTSRTTILAVVIGLVLVTLVCVGGGIALTWTDHKVPDQLWNLAIFLGGALAAVLSSTRGTLGASDKEPSTVTLSSPTPVAVDAGSGSFPGKP